MVQEVEMTKKEQIEMYMKSPKKELCEMLIEANRHLKNLSVITINNSVPYQKCPKCDGQGTVSKPPYIAGDVHEWSSSSASHICDVCNGVKIISTQIPDESEPCFTVNLNNKAAQNYRCKQMEKLLDAPSKLYIFIDGKYIELKP